MLDSSDQPKLKWGDSLDLLSDVRKRELRERLLSWIRDQSSEARPDPFIHERLNGLEVFWLAACTLAGSDGDSIEVAKMLINPSSRLGLRLPALNLSQADLTEAVLQGAYLREAILAGANLAKASLYEAYLRGVILTDAILREVYLVRADLREADLRGTTLTEANLRESNLRGANLSRAVLSRCNLYAADLTGAALNKATLYEAHLQEATLTESDLSEATLIGANFTEARLVRTNMSHVDMSGGHVYGISTWNVTLDGATQTNLRITPDGEPEITVDNLEMAQFLYLMLHNEKIRQVIDTLTSKVVLILGRFKEPRKQVLDALRDALRQYNYLPVLFDFDGPVSASTTETVSLLARMARFVVADLTDPSSVPYELAKIVPEAHVPVQALLLEGATTFAMVKDLWQLYPHLMLPLRRYTTIDDLIATLPESIIAPAEAKVAELQRQRTLPVSGLS